MHPLAHSTCAETAALLSLPESFFGIVIGVSETERAAVPKRQVDVFVFRNGSVISNALPLRHWKS